MEESIDAEGPGGDRPSAGRQYAHVVAFFPPALGGMERVAEALALGQAGRGEVNVVTTRPFSSSLPHLERRGGLTIRRHRAVVVANSPVAPGMILSLLRLPSSAVLHAHVAQAGVPELVWLAAALTGRPYVVHFHLDVESSGPMGWILPLYKRVILGAVLRHAARVIVLTPSQAQMVVGVYGVDAGRVVVIPNGVDTHRFRPPVELAGVGTERPLRLLYVGRLSFQKNVPRLIRAIAKLDVAVDAVIVGDGEERARVRREIERSGVTQVRLVGAQHGSDLVEWYQWADVFVLPSDQEGMPLVVLEAMAAGLPVLGTDVAGTRDLLAGVGLLCPPSDEGVASGITELAQKPDMRTRMSAQSRRRAEGRSWSAVVDCVDDLYRQMEG